MNYKTKILLSVLAISSIMIGCGSSNSDTSSANNANNGSSDTPVANSRFVSMTMNSQIVMQDTSNKLEWVNGAGGCHPMVPGKTEQIAFNEAENHCASLDFATHTDWRVPTIEEVQTFTVDMQNAGITPYYQNPSCPRLVGYNADKTIIKNTNTHNTPPIGMITDWAELNAGVRCVRDISTNN